MSPSPRAEERKTALQASVVEITPTCSRIKICDLRCRLKLDKSWVLWASDLYSDHDVKLHENLRRDLDGCSVTLFMLATCFFSATCDWKTFLHLTEAAYSFHSWAEINISWPSDVSTTHFQLKHLIRFHPNLDRLLVSLLHWWSEWRISRSLGKQAAGWIRVRRLRSERPWRKCKDGTLRSRRQQWVQGGNQKHPARCISLSTTSASKWTAENAFPTCATCQHRMKT